MCSGLEQKATETQLLPEYTLLHMLFSHAHLSYISNYSKKTSLAGLIIW